MRTQPHCVPPLQAYLHRYRQHSKYNFVIDSPLILCESKHMCHEALYQPEQSSAVLAPGPAVVDPSGQALHPLGAPAAAAFKPGAPAGLLSESALDA
jgi:hypothetical protein